jgi:hypothetical protein
VVATLLAGSEPWFEYTCREKQASGDFDSVPELLAAWIERYGRTARVIEAENRQALLSFDRDPGATFEFLRQRLGLRFDDQREAAVEQHPLPTRLDPTMITRDAWSSRAFRLHPQSLDGFQDSALFWLAGTTLDSPRLHELLKRLRRPDVPMLAALVVRDLAERTGAAFGELTIHGLRVWSSSKNVRACDLSSGKSPSSSKRGSSVCSQMRIRLGSKTPPSASNSSRGCGSPSPCLRYTTRSRLILYHALLDDMNRGAPSRERFLAYLRLPHSRKLETDYPKRFERKELVDPAASYATGLPDRR